MAIKLIDFSSDSGRQLLHKIAVKYAIPNYVKTASTDSLELNSEVGSDCAILSPTRKLPCHTKAACWLSHAYYLEQRDHIDSAILPQIERYLAKRAAFWGIEDDIKQLAIREVELIKQACESDEKLPVRTVQEAYEAKDWLLGQYTDTPEFEVPYAERRKLASKLIDYADAEPEFMPFRDELATLKKIASVGGCYDGSKVAKSLEDTKNPIAIKLAEGVRDLRGDDLQSFHSQLVEVTEKFAVFKVAPELILAPDQPFPVVTLSNGAVYSKASFIQLPSDIQDILQTPNTVYANTERLAKQAGELSVDMADYLVTKCAEHGIKPLLDPVFRPVSTLKEILD